MGRASREKWSRRLQAQALTISQTSAPPWYESNLLWGTFTTVIAIILAVVPSMKHDLRWLLFVAGTVALVPIWLISKNIPKHSHVTWIAFLVGTALVVSGLYWLNRVLDSGGDAGTVEARGTTDAKLDEIADLLRNQSNSLKPQVLLKRYPLGYIIFELDYQNAVFPYQSESILANYDLDWSVVRYTTNTSNQIEIRLPDLRAKDGTVSIENTQTGGEKRVGPLGCVGLKKLEICAEILAIRNTGIVFLIGLIREG